MVDLDWASASAFVKQSGDSVERARLDYLLQETPPAAAIIEQLFDGQRPDGGWAPFWKPDFSSLDATCFRLAQADQLGLTSVEPVAKALRFLIARQREDGSWQEEQSVAGYAPSWAKPGLLAATLYLTANCGYCSSLVAGGKSTAKRAARLLLRHASDDEHAFAHSLWLAAGLWYRVGYHEAAEDAMEQLATKLTSLPASNVSWLVITVVRAGAPASHPLIERAITQIVREQQPNGRWESKDGPEEDVHATLEALRALRLTGELG